MKLCKKRWALSGIALVSSLAIVLSAFPSFADEDISSLEGQSTTLQSELEDINEEILSLSEEISTAEMQIEIMNGEIMRTSDALTAAEENETQQYEDMKSRIKYMYEHGNATLLEMLFSAENMTDFLNKADFIEHLSEYDRSALDSLKEVHAQIKEQKETLEIQQASLKEIQADLTARQAELQAKADETSTNLADVQSRLAQARAAEAARIAAQETISGGYDNSVVNGGAINATADDITLLAAIIQCEAYQDYDSLLAVATVIMNRVADPRFPNTISGVIYAQGQFEPTWSGRLQDVLNSGPTSLSMQVAQDAVNGARLEAVSNCFFFLYAGSTNRPGVNIGGNLFFQSW